MKENNEMKEFSWGGYYLAYVGKEVPSHVVDEIKRLIEAANKERLS